MDVAGLFSLDGRTALVTGGSRGIGRMIAEGFLAQGARVIIAARKAAACDEAAGELSALGECLSLPADVSSLDGVRDLVGRLSAQEARLDVLVNNAGAAWNEPFESFPENGWDKVVDLNMKTPFFLTQACMPLLTAPGADRPRKGRQHLVRRRDRGQPAGDVQLPREQGRPDPADPPDGAAADLRRDRRERDRSGGVRLRDEPARPRRRRRGRGAHPVEASACPRTWQRRRSSWRAGPPTTSSARLSSSTAACPTAGADPSARRGWP